jgi:hypothetical protein
VEEKAARNPKPRVRDLDRIRFALELLVLRGLGYRLLRAASIVIAVAVVAGGLAALLDADSSELSENEWWAFLRLTGPGYGF